jgi:alkaline phosphatase D
MLIHSRRSFLAASASAAIVTACAPFARGARDAFALGVASGDPAPDGFVIWTRLAPDPLHPDPALPGGMSPAPVEVSWQVAEDAALTRVVRKGVAVARAEDAHTIHVEVGGLAPDRWYFYRFFAGGSASAVGRTRTAPSPGAVVDRLRLAFASCADWQQGYFSAYRHMAADAPDLVAFLGDYIYEFIEQRWAPIRLHSDGLEARDLRTYRNRYAQYRTDPDLQALHAAAPCLCIWDDHEVHNDYADRWSQDLTDPAMFLARRSAAYRAYWEHMPLRAAARPNGPAMALHRFVDWGGLARIWMLDERQYRSRPPCYGPPSGRARVVNAVSCAEYLDPGRSVLGAAQERWLGETMSESRARWNLFGQGVMMTEFVQPDRMGAPGHWSDSWSGHPAARARFLRRLADTGVANPIVMSGDIHSFWANELKLDYADPRAPVVGTEFVGTSISSPGVPYDVFSPLARAMPHVRYFESRQRGYVGLDISRARTLASFRIVSDVRDPKATVSTLARFAVEDGRPGAIPA